MTYMTWQMDMKRPLPENVRLALEHHERKYGSVPNLIEHGKIDLPPYPGVRYCPISIPANILFVAVE
jgi:hypothetical protein